MVKLQKLPKFFTKLTSEHHLCWFYIEKSLEPSSMPAAICPGTKQLRTGTCGPYTWFLAQEVGHMSAKKIVLIKQKKWFKFSETICIIWCQYHIWTNLFSHVNTWIKSNWSDSSQLMKGAPWTVCVERRKEMRDNVSKLCYWWGNMQIWPSCECVCMCVCVHPHVHWSVPMCTDLEKSK